MCGIVAIIDSTRPVAPAQIDAMRSCINHRGPDAGGALTHQNARFSVGLGSQRLSIIDLSTAGSMPMTNEDGSVWIVYNGEVYNHRELRAELERRGHRYRSETDTETVLHAYEEYGPDCFARFNGMFACAIYDEPRQRVVVARDRTGVKPLYYTERQGMFAFASELKALVHSGLAPFVIDPEALDVYLALGYVPAPYALVQGVRKLPAGTYGIYADGRFHIRCYWRPALTGQSAPPQPWEETVAQTRATVTAAVRGQLMSDVPVGVMLSGGLDSTIIAAIAQQTSAEPLHTFSIGFETRRSDLEPIYNYDREHARSVAAALGTVHHEIIAADADTLADQLRHLLFQLDEPVWEPTFLSIYLISQLARAHNVKVLLSGDGSDELFAGYPWHPTLARLERIERLPGLRPLLALLARMPGMATTRAKAQDLGRKYRRGDVAKYHAQYDVFDAEVRARLFARPLAADPIDSLVQPLFANHSAASLPARFALTELALWVGEHFNQRLDRMAMAASVEGRVPFQDNAVVDLALALSDGEKLRGGVGKAPLRAAFAHCVPAAVLQRPKRPFAAPATAWMNGALRPLILQALSPAALVQLPGIEPGIIAGIPDRLRDRLPVRQEQIWTLFHLVTWIEAMRCPPSGVAADDGSMHENTLAIVGGE